MQAVYFAYGSNLASHRMRERVPSARAAGPLFLPGYQITTDKAGRDGTGKANLKARPGAGVWGVGWQLDPSEWPLLDACERGYARIRVEPAGVTVAVATYVSDRLTADPVLASEYKAIILSGAREHGLPPDWISLLEALPAR